MLEFTYFPNPQKLVFNQTNGAKTRTCAKNSQAPSWVNPNMAQFLQMKEDGRRMYLEIGATPLAAMLVMSPQGDS